MRHHQDHDTDDKRLLEALAEALEASAGAPTDAERLAFRRMAADTLAQAPRRPRPARWLWPFPTRRPWPAFAAAFAAVLVVVGAVAVMRPVMPDPVRAAVHAVGLPVDSVELAHTRRSMDTVRHDLTTGDTTQLEEHADTLTRQLADLSGDDHSAVRDEADRLLAEARAAVAAAHHTDSDSEPATTPTTQPPPAATTPTSTPTPTSMGHDSGDVTHDSSDDDHAVPTAETAATTTTTTTTSPSTGSSAPPTHEDDAPHEPDH